jgi:hypothetical protein
LASISPTPAVPESVVVLALIDETETFAQNWQASKDWLALVLARLKPRDGFGLIGIDDKAFDPDDMRLPIRFLDRAWLRAKQQQQLWAQEVKGLERRKARHERTDILGAFRHAAHFIKPQPGVRPIVLVFSDMDQTPRMPRLSDAEGLKFPPGTEVYCLFVDASDLARAFHVDGDVAWEALVRIWRRIFAQAGVAFSEFYQHGDVSAGVNKALPPR